jgi:hypothetical protein
MVNCAGGPNIYYSVYPRVGRFYLIAQKEELRTGIGTVDFMNLIRVEPNFVPTTLKDRRSKPLLEFEGHHREHARKTI